MKKLAYLVFLTGPLAFANPKSTTTAATNSVETPLTVCKNLVDSAVKKDFDGVQKWSMEWGGPKKGKHADKGFAKMHEDHFAKLEKLNCTTEVIANDRAFVEAQADGGKRLIPFVKTETGWKFDVKTYMSFYGLGPKHGGHANKGKG